MLRLFYAQFINLPMLCMHNHKNYGNFVKNANNELEKISFETNFIQVNRTDNYMST